MPTFWRVLEDAPLFDLATLQSKVNHQSTRRRWLRSEYNSTHKSRPTEWQNTWLEGGTEPAAYELLCNSGLHTPAARAAFLQAAADLGLESVWPEHVLVAVGELDGTCAWETKEQSWHYVLGKTPQQAIEDCTITPEKLALSWVVEFTGDDLGVAIPENQGGGRQVRVTHAGQVIPAQQFAEANNFVIPWEEEKEPELM